MRRTPLLATVLLLLPLAGCSGDDTPAGRAEPSSTASASTGDEAATGTAAEEQAAPALTIGDQPYVPPCALLPPDDAARLLPFTTGTEVTEHGRGASATEKEMRARGKTVGGAEIATSCDYDLGDPARTVVKLTVRQFPSEAAAAAQWRTYKEYGDGKLPEDLRDNGGVFDALEQATVDIIRDAQKNLGGVRLRGLDERILWQDGQDVYLATTGNLLLELTRGRNYGFTPALDEGDSRFAERVLTRALTRAEELRGAGAEPAVGSTGQVVQPEGWPTFLDPCALLDADAVDVLFAGAELEEVTSSSTDADPDSNLTMDSAAGRSVQNSCERNDRERRHTAELLVQYVAPGDRPKRVLDSYLSQLAFSDPRPTPEQVRTIRGALRPGGMYDVDASYVLASTGGGVYFYALWDDYVLELEATQARKGRQGKGSLPELDSVDTYTLKTAMETVVAKARATLGTTP